VPQVEPYSIPGSDVEKQQLGSAQIAQMSPALSCRRQEAGWRFCAE
jgi:hypothetical protein